MDLLKNNNNSPTTTSSTSQMLTHLQSSTLSNELDHHQKQFIYMNQLLALNSFGSSASSSSAILAQHFTKEQLAEYHLAKLQLHQQLSNSTNLTNNNYGLSSPLFGQYGQLPSSNHVHRKAAPSNLSYNRLEHISNRYPYSHDEPKPQQSYIGLIAMAILSMPDQKMVLADIYQYIMDNYPYFRNRGPGWRNSIRHNLSLNDCFVKAGRSANGKGHYWAIHPANLDDFKKGDFRRRKAQRKVRRHMGLSVPDDDDDDDSPIPSPLPLVTAKPDTNSILSNSPFVSMGPTCSSISPSNNSSMNATNMFLTQHALNFFNSIRFGLQNQANLNETFYKHLIGLDIKPDAKRPDCTNNTNNIIKQDHHRSQFSIESLLAHHHGNANLMDMEPTQTKTKKPKIDLEQQTKNHSEQSSLSQMNLSMENNQPVNLTK